MQDATSTDNGNTDFAPPFIFNEPGDTCRGKLDHWSEGPSKFGPDPVPIAVFDTDEGPRSVWVFSSVLKAKFADIRPEVGEYTEIEYLGAKKSEASGFAYKNWAVRCPERPAAAFTPNYDDWGMVTPEGE